MSMMVPRAQYREPDGANKVSFVKSEIVIDAVSTTAEIDKALARLEKMARERGTAIGFGSALPVTIDRVAKWSKATQARGIQPVPISTIALKPKSS